MSEEYQVFIAFKNLDEDGKPTRDSVLAEELYRYLSEKGLNVFLSSVSLEMSGIASFKQAIDEALESSKILVAVGISRENLDSQWVHYEWDSFHNDILDGIKPYAKIFVYVEGIETSSLPRTLRQVTVIHHEPDSKKRLYSFITNALKSEPGVATTIDYPGEEVDYTNLTNVIADTTEKKDIQETIERTANITKMPNMTGKTISNYKIVRQLGRGGMGEVYLAEDLELDRQIALKLLSSEYAADTDFIARFKQEAKATAKLNHPNIVTIYEMKHIEDYAFIAMEYIDGDTLAAINAKGKLPQNKALEIAVQICEGLSKAHKAGIVHRDLKPGNIMINREGRVKILDFGLAKLIGDTGITRTGTTMGTPHYMSPEQVQGQKTIDQRSDIFSFGVVLYEMLARELPFQGDNMPAVSYAIVHKNPKPISESETSPGLEKIVEKALKKDPEERYQQIDDTLSDLKKEKWVGSASTQPTILVEKSHKAEDKEPRLPPKKSSSRRKSVLLISSLLIIVAALVSIFVFKIIKLPGSISIGTGTISISSDPEGAVVFAGDDSIGTTPIPKYTVASGSLLLHFEKPDFFPIDTSVVIKKDSVYSFSFPLQPIARVSIQVEPNFATVTLDGDSVSTFTLLGMALSVGDHLISMSANGYESENYHFSLVQGDNKPIIYTLKVTPDPPIVGMLRIDSNPSNALIFLDNRLTGRTPFEDNRVQPGSYRILIRLGGYEDYSARVKVDAGKRSRIDQQLVPLMGQLSVRVLPYGTIYIDGELREKETNVKHTYELPAVNHLILIEHPVIGKWKKIVQIKPDLLEDVFVDFSKKVKIIVTTGSAIQGEIFVDNKATGQFSPKEIILPIGLHTIEIRREGYEMVEEVKEINLEKDLTDPLILRLSKIQ